MLCFLHGVRPVEGFDLLAEDKPHSRPGALDHIAPYGNQQALDRSTVTMPSIPSASTCEEKEPATPGEDIAPSDRLGKRLRSFRNSTH
jgi:hypothetical protein